MSNALALTDAPTSEIIIFPPRTRASRLFLATAEEAALYATPAHTYGVFVPSSPTTFAMALALRAITTGPEFLADELCYSGQAYILHCRRAADRDAVADLLTSWGANVTQFESGRVG